MATKSLELVLEGKRDLPLATAARQRKRRESIKREARLLGFALDQKMQKEVVVCDDEASQGLHIHI